MKSYDWSQTFEYLAFHTHKHTQKNNATSVDNNLFLGYVRKYVCIEKLHASAFSVFNTMADMSCERKKMKGTVGDDEINEC